MRQGPIWPVVAGVSGSGVISGGGTVATGGFTLTVPATGTAALLDVANSFTQNQSSTGYFKSTDTTNGVQSGGASNYARLVHDGSNLYLKSVGAGGIYLQTSADDYLNWNGTRLGPIATGKDLGDNSFPWARQYFAEVSDPAAPAANHAVLFARDSGGGKTQLCVRFASGAVQVFATEP